MSAKRIFIDLETYKTRNPILIDQIRHEQRARVPAMNKSKEEKLMWNTPEGIESRTSEAIAKTSVDVLRAEILCIAIGIDEDPPEVITCMPEHEVEGLELFREWINENVSPETVWIGHNLQNFDLPVLINRFRALCIKPPAQFPTFNGRYWGGRIYDTMLRTPCQNGLGLVRLEDVCLAYGITSSKSRICLTDGTPLEGSTVGLAYERKEYDAIMEYARLDIDATRSLYESQTFDYTRDTWEADDQSLDPLLSIRDADRPLGERAYLILSALANMGKISKDLVPQAGVTA